MRNKADVSRASHLRRKYGLSLQQYDELLETQDHACALCRRHKDEFKTRLAVDHNHATGEIRGLLCGHCNHRVIGRHRDGTLLRRMAEYVERTTGLFVPKQKRPNKRRPNKGKLC